MPATPPARSCWWPPARLWRRAASWQASSGREPLSGRLALDEHHRHASVPRRPPPGSFGCRPPDSALLRDGGPHHGRRQQQNFGTNDETAHAGSRRARDPGRPARRAGFHRRSGPAGGPDGLPRPYGDASTAGPVPPPMAEEDEPAGLNIKLHPCCYATHAAIDAALDSPPLCRRGADRGDRVVGSRRRLCPPHPPPARRRPPGQFSLEYAVAAALIDREVTLASFDEHPGPAPTSSSSSAPSRSPRETRRPARRAGTTPSRGGHPPPGGPRRRHARVDKPAGHAMRPVSRSNSGPSFADCMVSVGLGSVDEQYEALRGLRHQAVARAVLDVLVGRRRAPARPHRPVTGGAARRGARRGLEQAIAAPFASRQFGRPRGPGDQDRTAGDGRLRPPLRLDGRRACRASSMAQPGKNRSKLDIKGHRPAGCSNALLERADVLIHTLGGRGRALGPIPPRSAMVVPRPDRGGGIRYGASGPLRRPRPMTCWCRVRRACCRSTATRTSTPGSASRSLTSRPGCTPTPASSPPSPPVTDRQALAVTFPVRTASRSG